MKEQLNDSSTAETVKVIKTFGITILIVIAATIWISAYDNLISRVEDLESKIDSITTSSNNYSYSHITTFENKTPEEGIDEALLYYDIKHPTIVKAQAILETAHFSSDLCVKNNNLFGLYDSKNKRYYSYNHWWESIEAYKELIQRKYNNSKYYYMFLEDIKYAKDKEYINKVKKIAEELE